MRVKVFMYDFIEDKILGAKLQDFEYNTPTLSYKVSDELLSTSPVIMGNWDKKGLVDRARREEIIDKILEVDADAVDLNGHFYNIDGAFEGKVNNKTNKGSVNDVYTCKNKVNIKNSNGIEITNFKAVKLLKENKVNITHADFCYIAYVVKEEAGNDNIEELQCIAYTSFNRSKKAKKTWKNLLSTRYSSVDNKQELKDSIKNNKSKLARQSLFYVLNGENDITNGAEYWDGTAFLAWGNSETNPYNKLGSNKFDEYKFIEIPKDIYDTYLANNGSSAKYNEEIAHDKNHVGTHEHITKTVRKKMLDSKGKPILNEKGEETFENVTVPFKIKYTIPASDFTNKVYWKSGSFYYETANKNVFGISATINRGKSIFWKLTKNRLTSSTPTK